jgi:hypothetical protein
MPHRARKGTLVLNPAGLMADTTNEVCDGCGRERGALCLVPTRRGAAVGHTTSDGRRMLLCNECIIDQVVTV